MGASVTDDSITIDKVEDALAEIGIDVAVILSKIDTIENRITGDALLRP